MEIQNLYAKNLLCFGEFELDFRACGKLTLIEGDNQDSVVAKSNGAGKTSIYEALLWIYTGQTKKGLTGDAVKNERAAKGEQCMGQSNFLQGGTHYRITRTRDGSPHIKLEVNAGLAGGWGDISKGTDKETQTFLESIIKMSPLTFGKMTYFGQEDVKAFAGMGDKDLKIVFEQALGIDFIRDDFEKVRQHGQEISKTISGIESDLACKNTSVEQLNEKITYLCDADTELKRQHAAQIDALQAEVSSLVGDNKALMAKIAGANGGADEPDVKHIEEELSRLNTTLTGLRKRLKESEGAAYRSQVTEEGFGKEVANCRNRIRKITDIIGKTCGECKKIYQPQDVKTAQEGIKSQWIKAGVGLKAAGAEKEKHRQQVQKLTELDEKLNFKINDLKAQVAKARADFDREVEAAAQAKKELGRIDNAIAAKTSTLNGLKAKKIGYEDDIRAAQAKATDLKGKIAALMPRLKEKEDELAVAGMLKSILGDAGLKNYVFNSVTPELNRLVNEYLQVLENINVEINTVKQLKNGEFRDKFSIEVINHSGSSTYRANSGGERQKIDFAISLAFNSVIRAMSEESVNLIFLDEPFESLDEASSESAVELIGRITGGSKALLVAHNSHIKHLTYEVMTVCKKGGFSTIIGEGTI